LTTLKHKLGEAFVLHARPYSNSSLLLELFTAEAGRFPAIARGAKRGSRNQTGLLQPFTPLWLSWSGGGEVKTVREVEQRSPPLRLSGRALFCGFYINELILRLWPRFDPHCSVFLEYELALSGLESESGAERCLRIFEKRLLSYLGYEIPLQHDARTGMAVLPDKRYKYVFELGPVEVSGNERDGAIVVQGSTLLALQHERLEHPEQFVEARKLMRSVLGYYLGPRPLKSRELFFSGGVGKQ